MTIHLSGEERYKQRRANGQCLWCGKPLDRNGSVCTICLRKGNARANERRKYLLILGICPECGKNKTTPPFKSCVACRKKRAMVARMRADSDYGRVYKKTVYDKRREQGLCVHCGKSPSDPGMVTCSKCRKKQREYRQTYIRKGEASNKDIWRYSGKCSRCGKNELYDGTSLCESCYNTACANLIKARAAQAEKRAKEREERDAAIKEMNERLKKQNRPRTMHEQRLQKSEEVKLKEKHIGEE